MKLSDQIEQLLHVRPTNIRSLHGGMIGEVYQVDLEDNSRIVAKVAQGNNATLDIEGYMLKYLADNSDLPVPDVLHSEKHLLLMSYIEGNSHFSNEAQAHAAELLAALHQVKGEQFGLERDTLIGSLHQPNPFSDSWLAFFAEHRLLYMARLAVKEHRLSQSTLRRIEKLCSILDKWLDEPEYPSLIHGDMWTTNILAKEGRITGFVDPAMYYAHPEIELAFSTLFGTFSTPFFRRYNELRPIPEGFFEIRRDIYNLYPLLVHVRLFGGGYAHSVESILNRLGV